MTPPLIILPQNDPRTSGFPPACLEAPARTEIPDACSVEIPLAENSSSSPRWIRFQRQRDQFVLSSENTQRNYQWVQQHTLPNIGDYVRLLRMRSESQREKPQPTASSYTGSSQMIGGMILFTLSQGFGTLSGLGDYRMEGGQVHFHGGWSAGQVAALTGSGLSFTLIGRSIGSYGQGIFGAGLGYYWSGYAGYITLPSAASVGGRLLVSYLNWQGGERALFSLEASANVAVTFLGALELALGTDLTSTGEVGAHALLNFTFFTVVAGPTAMSMW